MNRVREIIDARGISRYRFWKDTELDRATAYRLYNDATYIPSESVLEKICKAYGLKQEDIITNQSDGIVSLTTAQSPLPQAHTAKEKLTVVQLETLFWAAACSIKGAADASNYMEFILLLIFYKRLCDVFEDEFADCLQEFKDETLTLEIIEEDYTDALKEGRNPIVRFYIPQYFQWDAIRNHPEGLGKFVTTAMHTVAKINPKLDNVLNIKDFNEMHGGQHVLDDLRLAEVINILSRYRLGLNDVEPHILEQAYECLLLKFIESQGKKGSSFSTPREIGLLMAELINPESFTTLYDPACGSGSLLTKARLLYEQRYPTEKIKAPKLYGQEVNITTFAIAQMRLLLNDYTDSYIALGDAFCEPKFITEKNKLKRFDYVVTNPPWNIRGYDSNFYKLDSWQRFPFGIPPASSADWGWVQIVFTAMNDNGKAAIILPTGALFRGSDKNIQHVENKIRSTFVEKDFIESVILLPEGLFESVSIPAVILLLNRNKTNERHKRILFINASNYIIKQNRVKNLLSCEGINLIIQSYRNWQELEKLSKIVSLEDVRVANYNLLPSRYVDISDKIQHRPLNEIMADLSDVRLDNERINQTLDNLLAKLNLKS